MNERLLQFENIEAGYDGRKVIWQVSGEVPVRGRVVVIGPNGCGKSTLLRALMGVLPSTGETWFGGRDIRGFSATHRNRLGIGCMRQGVNVFQSLTARENLEMAFTGHQRDYLKRVEETLVVLPTVRDEMSRRAGLLSGGQRQCLALAMVLMNRPRILLLDEPLAGLSPKAAEGLLDALRGIHNKLGVAWLMVEHRLPLVRQVVEAVWIMREGQIIHKTADVSVLENPDELASHYKLT